MDGEATPDGIGSAPIELVPEPGPGGPAELNVILEPIPTASPGPWGPWATISWTLLCLAAMVAAQTVVAIAFVTVQIALNPREKIADIATNGNMLMLAGTANAPPVVGLVVLLIVVRRNRIRDYLALTWPAPRQVLWSSIGLILLLATSDLIAYLVGHPIVPPFVEEVYRKAWLPLLLFALLVAAPLGEEVLMRSFLYRGIADSRWGPGTAILLSSALWAIIHVQYGPYDIASIFLMGIFLGVVRRRTGSVPLTIMLHMIANAVATLEAFIHSHVVR
jgi:membrane protease YdiL (CAAX protease family)